MKHLYPLEPEWAAVARLCVLCWECDKPAHHEDECDCYCPKNPTPQED